MEFLDFLTRLPISKHLNQTAIRELAAELEAQKLQIGAVLFSQDDPGDALYFVVSGKLRVNINSANESGTFVSDLVPGECVGEMALLTGQQRSATVTALEDSELLRLTKVAYNRLERKYPDLLAALASQLLPRFQRDQTRLVLKRLFGDLDDVLLRELLGKLDCRHLNSGQILFRQGEPGDEMYIIIQGRLRMVLEESDGHQRTLGEVGAGECIGEFALLAESGTAESLRTATIYAARSTDMIVITRTVFENLMHQYPQVLVNLTRQIVRRATSIGKPAQSRETSMVIALLPAQAGQALGKFVEQLTDSLAVLAPAMFLNAQRFEQLFGKVGVSKTPLDHPLSLVINEWLDERERENRYLIYEAAPPLEGSGRLTSWAQRCVEDADLILLVGEAGTDAHQTSVEKALSLARCQSRLELVLLHPSDRKVITGTAEWLKERRSVDFPVQAHHHVRMGNQADFRRLARRIAGKPVGLTLSGGGARGWAHLGVLRALEEANLDFDWVAGASMGSIVAAGCALDWSSERLCELASRFSDPKKLLDYTFPYASITSTRHITKLFQELLAGANIEDTWRPFFCVSADLTHGKERIHTSGPLWKAVRASMAFPGIFAPILDEGSVLIDGGAANNLPIDRMREMCPNGTVIGVELHTNSPVIGEYDFGPSLSGWQVLLARFPFYPGKVKAPSLLDIVAGVVHSNNCYRFNETWRSADLLIKVPVEEYGLLEFEKYAQIIDLGYRAAQEQLKGFKP